MEASPDDAGTYVLVASNDAGETSCSCYVFVKNLSIYETPDSEITNDTEPIKPSINFPLTDQTVTKGFEAILECVIIGQPEPEVRTFLLFDIFCKIEIIFKTYCLILTLIFSNFIFLL